MLRAFVRIAAIVVIAGIPNNLVAQESASHSASPKESASSDEQLRPYAGFYRIAPRHDFAISVQKGNGQVGLLFSDLTTDVVRLIVPIAKDTFAAGPELLRPSPVAFRVVFDRDARGSIIGARLLLPDMPGTPTGRRLPIRSVPVSFANGAVSISGTLYLPPGAAKHPSVVMLHGSEDSDRDSFGATPLAIAAQGFAALVFDKRGTGRSTGSWQSAGLEDRADDVVAAVNMLRRRDDVDASRIGFVGTSEGGWIAPLAASRVPGIVFIVAISGGGLTKADALVYKERRRALEAGSATNVDSVVRAARALVDQSAARVQSRQSPTGFDKRVTYDPTPHWKAFSGSILSLGGEFDVLEDANASAERLRRIFAERTHPDFTVKVLPKGHHMLFLGSDGTVAEFARFRGITGMVPGYWDVLLRWLNERRS